MPDEWYWFWYSLYINQDDTLGWSSVDRSKQVKKYSNQVHNQ